MASVIILPGKSTADFENYCRSVVPKIQSKNIAALVAEDTQVMGRVDADGLYLGPDKNNLSSCIARFSPQKIVGCGGVMDRHNALDRGEAGPDFVLLGKLGKDIKPEPHPKNLTLAAWWAQFVEVPGVSPAGNSLESVVAVAQTGIDFVLLQSAVFATDVDPQLAIEKANALLDEFAPELLEDGK